MPLLRLEFRVQGQVEHAKDAVHGGADLVAHASQKLALGPAGRLRRLLRLLQLFVKPLAVRDVLDDLDAIVGFSRRLDLERDGHVGPDEGAVFADETFLHTVTGGFTPLQGVKFSEVIRQILGVRYLRERLPDQLSRGVAEDLADSLVEAQEMAAEVLMGDADSRVLEGATEALLAFPQRFLDPLVRGDVLGEATDLDYLAGFIAHKSSAGPDDANLACVLAHDAVLEFVGRDTVASVFHRAGDPLAVVRVGNGQQFLHRQLPFGNAVDGVPFIGKRPLPTDEVPLPGARVRKGLGLGHHLLPLTQRFLGPLPIGDVAAI